MNDTGGQVDQKLQAYKNKYYLNLFWKGLITSVLIISAAFLLFTMLEYFFRLNSLGRATFFYSFLALTIYFLAFKVLAPIISVFTQVRRMSDEDAARRLAPFFPTESDKLLNILQLRKIATFNSLAQAGITQKSGEIATINFAEAVKIEKTSKSLWYLLAPGILIIFIIWQIPNLLEQSTTRIIQYNQAFEEAAPFTFQIDNQELIAYRNENFTIELQLEGSGIPKDAFVQLYDRNIKMSAAGLGKFSYVLNSVLKDFDFRFEAAGFVSSTYKVKVVDRPDIKNFNLNVSYPDYLGLQNQRIENSGNATIPEGSKLQWQFQTQSADSLALTFTDPIDTAYVQSAGNQVFEYERRFLKSSEYEVNLFNEYSANRNKIAYTIDVIKDEYPSISLNAFEDTVLFSFIVVGGNINDDYGITDLRLFYRVLNKDNEPSGNFENLNLETEKGPKSQSYYYRWEVKDLQLEDGERIEYYTQVWDNDGVNGRKFSRSDTKRFKIPSKEEVKENLENSTQQVDNQIDKTKNKAKNLKERLEEIEEELKGKKQLEWQDEKKLRDLIEERKRIEEELQKLIEEFQDNTQKRERFNDQNDDIKNKVEQIQELMNELLDDETKQLYEELQKLLNEQKNLDDVQKKVNELNNKERNLENELERTLEVFKRLKFDLKLEQARQEIEDIQEKQEELSKETGKESNDLEELEKKQEELNNEFKEAQKDLEELEEINQSLKTPKPLQDTEVEEKEIQQNQEQSQQQLQDGERKESQKSQKKASDNLQKLAQQLQQMQSSLETTVIEENIDDLRDILDNLVKLSFNQEDVLKEFRGVRQSDPRFIELSQDQLKLKGDAQIIEDSLLSLAQRVLQIQSFITREVGEMNRNMDEAITAIRERKKGSALSGQQFAMTSMNNLALLLNDILSQLQDQLSSALGNPQPQNGDQQIPSPSLSELQKQLNEQIDQLKKSGKTGRELSEELARLAAEQERIRNSLKELEEKAGLNNKGEKPGAGGTQGIQEKMEETEIDLVNKRITQETIKRQEDILTRLLEAEDALRERDKDDKREAQRPNEYERIIPQAFEEYLKAKEQQIELLKTVPPRLNPYYKNEVNNYFKRIEK